MPEDAQERPASRPACGRCNHMIGYGDDPLDLERRKSLIAFLKGCAPEKKTR
jgi:hypothetical protein